MLGAYAVATTLGLLLGLRYKAAAMVVLSAVVVLGGTVAGPLMGRSILWAFLVAFGAAFALQCGYLLGLSVTCVAARAKYWPRAARRYIRNYGAALTSPKARAR